MKNSKMKEIKPVQFPMKIGAYVQLKKRANQLDMKVGDFVENLLSSLELRLDAMYKKAGIETKCDYTDKELIKLMLSNDSGAINNSDIENAICDIKRTIITKVEKEWQPFIEF